MFSNGKEWVFVGLLRNLDRRSSVWEARPEAAFVKRRETGKDKAIVPSKRLCRKYKPTKPGNKMRPGQAAFSSSLLFARTVWTDLAIPNAFKVRMRIQEGSNSYQASPCRAEVGWAW